MQVPQRGAQSAVTLDVGDARASARKRRTRRAHGASTARSKPIRPTWALPYLVRLLVPTPAHGDNSTHAVAACLPSRRAPVLTHQLKTVSPLLKQPLAFHSSDFSTKNNDITNKPHRVYSPKNPHQEY